MNFLNINALVDVLDTGVIVLIVVLSVLGLGILGALFFILDKFVLRKRRCKRTINNLEKKFTYLHTLLTSTDFQYAQRIELISRTNLLYGEIYQDFLKRYKEIRDNKESAYQEALNNLVHKLDEGDIKAFRYVYKDSLGIFASYEDAVKQYDEDIVKIIKPEDDARQNSLILKDKYRETKSSYNEKENELSFVSETFTKVFSTIDEKFKVFESLVEQADYEEANKILPQVETVLTVLNEMIEKVPPLVDRVENSIRNEEDLLVTHYDTLIREGYSLRILNFESEKEYIDQTINEVKENIRALKISSCSMKLDDVSSKMKYLESKFKEEEQAHEEFIKDNDRIYNEFIILEKEFITVKNRIANYTKYYIMDEDHKKKLNEVQEEINKVTKDKTIYDNSLHSFIKSPYSELVIKMRNLEVGTKSIKGHFEDFKKYLASLKDNVEDVNRKINNIYFSLKDNEELLRSFHNENLKIKLNPLFDECYALIDNIASNLKYIPIDVNDTLLLEEELISKSNTLFNEMKLLNENRQNAIDLITSMNRERIKFSDINIQLSQAENLYLNGDYVGANQMSQEIQRKLAEKDKL